MNRFPQFDFPAALLGPSGATAGCWGSAAAALAFIYLHIYLLLEARVDFT